MFFGHWEILLLVVVVVLLFGSGRISSLMGDVAKGIKSFKKGLRDEPGAPGSQQASAVEDASSKDGSTDGDKTKT